MTLFFVLAASLSLSLALLTFVSCFLVSHRKKDPAEVGKRLLSPLQLYTCFIFAALLILLLPVMYGNGEVFVYQGEFSFFRRLLMTVRETMLVFLLEGSFDTVLAAVAAVTAMPRWASYFYTVYAAVLYVLAPILTASFILSLFRNVSSEIRYFFSNLRPHYVFSELNARSLQLARDIVEEGERKRVELNFFRRYLFYRFTAPLPVFTDVYLQNEEEDYELLAEARGLGAVLLKRDITQIKIRKGKHITVEFFLIGENESENVAQAMKLIESYKTRPRTKVYVFATTAGSRYILDSADKGELTVTEELKALLQQPANRELLIRRGLFTLLEQTKQPLSILDSGFKVRRIDDVGILARRTLEEEPLFALCRERERQVLSILIIGMGRYGRELLKAATWLCRADGIRLEINVIDKRSAADGEDVRSHLCYECPELLDPTYRSEDGQDLSIEFFNGIDCFTGELDNLFDAAKSPTVETLTPDGATETAAERLRRTTVAFVTLGDDDLNIEAAVHLRVLFDRLLNCFYQEIPENELPRIKAVVYDDKKARSSGEGGLINYWKQPLHIDVIGSLSEQYRYEKLFGREAELEALRYHVSWLRLESVVRTELQPYLNAYVGNVTCASGNLPNPADAECVAERERCADEAVAAIALKYPDVDRERLSVRVQGLMAELVKRDYDRFKNPERNPYLDNGRDVNPEHLIGEIRKFESFEYFRQSSLAKAIHKVATVEAFRDRYACEHNRLIDRTRREPSLEAEAVFCVCDKCEALRRIENTRWNAYIRSLGYRYHEKRAVRAMRHNCLVPYDTLSEYLKLQNQ